jgi:hypothetical protein
MTSTRDMIRSHPIPSIREGIAEAITACFDCAEISTICADACLAEPMVANLVRCITLNQNCATISYATGTVLARQSSINPAISRKQVQACLDVCEACAVECEMHGGNMEHCAVCAAACRRCADVCRSLLAQM